MVGQKIERVYSIFFHIGADEIQQLSCDATTSAVLLGINRADIRRKVKYLRAAFQSELFNKKIDLTFILNTN